MARPPGTWCDSGAGSGRLDYRAGMVSAGILLYRLSGDTLEVLLAHPGGPFWANKDLGAWSLPKGEAEPGEDLLSVAKREFREELGVAPPGGPFVPLGAVTQRSGKEVHAWACEGDFDPRRLASNTFVMEWPRGSGRAAEFPEIDRVAWFSLEEARREVNAAQADFLDRLAAHLG